MSEETVVEVPSSPRKIMAGPVLVVALGVAMLGLTAVDLLGGGPLRFPFTPLWMVGYGLYLGVPAYRQRLEPVLRFDTTGVSMRNGRALPWAGVAAVWVGSRSGRWLPKSMRTTRLYVYSQAAVDFSRRAGSQVANSRSLSAPTTWSPGELAAALRRVTDAPVHTADDLSLRALRRILRGLPG